MCITVVVYALPVTGHCCVLRLIHDLVKNTISSPICKFVAYCMYYKWNMFLLILHFKTFQFMDQPENWYSRNIKETIVCSLILCVLHQETAALPVAPAVVTTSQPAPCVHHRAPVARGFTSMWSTSTSDRWIYHRRWQRDISPGLC